MSQYRIRKRVGGLGKGGTSSSATNPAALIRYWGIGKVALEYERKEGIKPMAAAERVSEEFRRKFPGKRGLSPHSIWVMRCFARAWPESAIGQPPLVNLRWKHHVRLIDLLPAAADRLWYAARSVRHGWSIVELERQIRLGAHKRQGRAVSNFKKTLPRSFQAEAQEVTKNVYVFDFVKVPEDARERRVEESLVGQVKDFMAEMGGDFALVGNQLRLDQAGKDFYLDMLFYHLRLRCFVVIELKGGEFVPEVAGKMNFYLSAVDEQFRRPIDRRSIGIILCRDMEPVIVEKALRGMSNPMAVATYVTNGKRLMTKSE